MSTNMQRFITKVQLAVAVFFCISSLLLLPTQSFEIRTAILPADLPSIQDCRRSAYAGKSVNLPAAKSFCNADQIQREGYICIIAKDSSNSNDDGGVVLGTADLNTKVCIILLLYISCILFLFTESSCVFVILMKSLHYFPLILFTSMYNHVIDCW